MAVYEKSIKIKELEKQLNSVLNDKDTQKDGVVVSIEGPWGVGKTYFWHDYVSRYNIFGKNLSTNQKATEYIHYKNTIYISLFGINSVSELKEQIVSNLTETNTMLKKVEKKWGNNKLYGISGSMLYAMLKKEDYKDTLICFDDIERISPKLSIKEVLGLVSELKESKKSTVVIINNNKALEEQDRQNIKRATTIDTNSNKISTTETIETNNQEIFDTYSEKVIDYRFAYEPHIDDILIIIEESMLQDELFISNDKLLSQIHHLLHNTKNINERYNIRKLKTLIRKLRVLDTKVEILKSSDIEQSIKTGIVLRVFQKIYKSLKINKFEYDIYPSDELEYYIDNLVYKNLVYNEIENSIKNLHTELLQHKQRLALRSKFTAITSEFCISHLLPDDYLTKLMELIKQENIIQNMGEDYFSNALVVIRNTIEKCNKYNIEINQTLDKLESIKESRLKEYIKYIVDNNIKLPDYLIAFINSNNLNDYYEYLKNPIDPNDTLYKKVCKAMNSIKESSFVNSLILLNSISIDNHYQWLLDKEKEYIEATYNFMQYLKGYHNKKEYSQIRENIMQAYIKLHDRAEYKIKVETILERLAIEYEIDESNNISLKQPKQRNKLII